MAFLYHPSRPTKSWPSLRNAFAVNASLFDLSSAIALSAASIACWRYCDARGEVGSWNQRAIPPLETADQPHEKSGAAATTLFAESRLFPGSHSMFDVWQYCR